MIRKFSLWLLSGMGVLLMGCGATSTPAPLPTVPVQAATLTALERLATAAPPPVPLDLPELNATAAPRLALPARPQATPVPGDPVRVVIEDLQLDRPLMPVGLDPEYMPIVPKHDIGWYFYSAQPGQGENVVLWGHVLRFRDAPDIAAPFARLHELQPGARITLYTDTGAAYTYTVVQQVWATPEQVEYILPQGREQLTLVSCIGDKVIVDESVEMSHRLITIAVPEG